MKTQTVYIKEFKVLSDFTANMNGNHVLILGDNEVGKSSLLQFIQIALGNQKNIPANAKGSGHVVFEKDGKKIVVAVSFKDGKPVVDVRGEGIHIDNKKSAIASLFGAVDFDPIKFVEKSKTEKGRKEQVEDYKSFFDMETINFMDTMERKIKTAFDERTALNRDIKNLAGAINLHPLINHLHELDTFQPVELELVYDELKRAQNHNANIDKVEQGIEQKTKDITMIQEQIAKLSETLNSLSEDVRKGTEWLKDKKRVDVTPYERSIQTATEANQKVTSAMRLKEDMAKKKELEDAVGELTALIDSSKEAIVETIKQIDSPVEGLTYDEDGLYWNGTPVNPDNLSTSQIIELGIRLKMAENPNLGMLFIENGESIGIDRLKVIKELADKNGWQLIIEQVERGTKEIHVQILSLDGKIES